MHKRSRNNANDVKRDEHDADSLLMCVRRAAHEFGENIAHEKLQEVFDEVKGPKVGENIAREELHEMFDEGKGNREEDDFDEGRFDQDETNFLALCFFRRHPLLVRVDPTADSPMAAAHEVMKELLRLYLSLNEKRTPIFAGVFLDSFPE